MSLACLLLQVQGSSELGGGNSSKLVRGIKGASQLDILIFGSRAILSGIEAHAWMVFLLGAFLRTRIKAADRKTRVGTMALWNPQRPLIRPKQSGRGSGLYIYKHVYPLGDLQWPSLPHPSRRIQRSNMRVAGQFGQGRITGRPLHLHTSTKTQNACTARADRAREKG